ncbi:type I methionyl aminopeptidase [Kribbella sp. NBC_00359]|uniref:type I methionyl aminopeptidase n=1 Tax=Kribbella sp. NBC_00359 TaxID=2975966 RepID=UPI002E1E2766
MVELKTPAEIEQMRTAGRVVANALQAVRKEASVGVSLRELDEVARDVLRSAGAVSLFEGYQPGFATSPFSGVICTSVNDAVLHGLPTDLKLEDGDLLNVDCGASVDGWCADSAISFSVGTPHPEDLELIATTERALAAGIAAAVDRNRLGDISAAIGRIGHDAGLGTNLDFGGHGIGHRMHEDPHIPNGGRSGRGLKLRAGHVFAIEPWFWSGPGSTYRIDEDGWTLRSADQTRGAHAEHTVAITPAGPEILTLP